MNNAQFRKLLETPRPPPSSDSNDGRPSATPALGSRQRSSIPMTPRSLSSNTDFGRQLAAHRAAQQADKPTKKFRSQAAPKGTKFGEGYTDRAKAREEDDTVDEREERLLALKELLKEGTIEQDEYEKQTKLLGGDVSSTHLVRGLDFALLQRVKAGENVLDGKTTEQREEVEEELEDRLERALETEVATVERKKEKKKGELAAKPKTRAEILAELKRERRAKKEALQPALGSKFKKIGAPKEVERVVEDVKVKHVMGKDGKVKRKIKRSDKEKERAVEGNVEGKAPLGMMPPPPMPTSKPAAPEEEEEDDDIFADAGDYDPLAGIPDDASDSDSSADEATAPKRPKPEDPSASTPQEEKSILAPTSMPAPPSDATSMPPPPPSLASDTMPPPSRPSTNYFDEPTTADDDTYKPPSSAASLIESNPDLAAALARASKIGAKEESAQEKKRKALMEAQERDSYDIDMGFGGTTHYDDEEEEEGGKPKGGAPRKRKRKGAAPKKGDKNSADVVGKIVEQKYGGK